MTKTIKILYGSSSYTFCGPICDYCVLNTPLCGSKHNDWESENVCEICSKKKGYFYEVGTSSHQVCFSNDFCSGWEDMNGWYMGCVFLKSPNFECFERHTLSEIFKQAKNELGDYVNGENVTELISNIESRINQLVTFLENKFNEIFHKYGLESSNISWEWSNNSPDFNKFNLLK